MKRDVWVVTPTLNEAATIQAVVRSVRPFCDKVLVIDGDSDDGTAQLAHEAGARVEIFKTAGKGSALRHALKIVPTRVTVFIDADGSHDGRDIPRLVGPVWRRRAAMVVASRWTGGSDELHGDMNKWVRRSGSKLLTMLINIRFRSRLSDIQNGFRALDTRIGRDIGLNAADFTIEQEMVMKFRAGGFRVVNVPSHEYARQGGEAKLNLGRVWFRFGVVVLRHVFGLERARIHRKTDVSSTRSSENVP